MGTSPYTFSTCRSYASKLPSRSTSRSSVIISAVKPAKLVIMKIDEIARITIRRLRSVSSFTGRKPTDENTMAENRKTTAHCIHRMPPFQRYASRFRGSESAFRNRPYFFHAAIFLRSSELARLCSRADQYLSSARRINELITFRAIATATVLIHQLFRNTSTAPLLQRHICLRVVPRARMDRFACDFFRGRALVRAAAVIIPEIERLDRAVGS